MARRMKRALGKNTEGGLLKASILRDDEVVQLKKKEDVERASHEENQLNFTQTNLTHDKIGELARDLGFLGNSMSCDRILNRTYNPLEDTGNPTTYLLIELKRPLIVNPPKAIIEME